MDRQPDREDDYYIPYMSFARDIEKKSSYKYIPFLQTSAKPGQSTLDL